MRKFENSYQSFVLNSKKKNVPNLYDDDDEDDDDESDE